jgi:hypothetical protein
MSRMLCLTISEADSAAVGSEEANPLLVVQLDGPMVRRVMALIIDHLAAEPEPTEEP